MRASDSGGASFQPSGSFANTDPEVWRQLAEAGSVAQFAAAWLGLQATIVGGVDGGIVVMDRAGDFETVAVWPEGYGNRDGLSAGINRAVSERKGIVARSGDDSSRLLLAFPIRVGTKLHGAVAFEISARGPEELQEAMRQLQWGTAWIQNWVLRGIAGPGERQSKRLATVLGLSALSLEERTFRGAATATLTDLASRLDCDRVSLGFVSGKKVKVFGLSHSAQFAKEMNLIRAVSAAMGESVDQQAVLVWPGEGRRRQHVLQAHERLARTHGDGAVCTVPFVDHEGRAFGAMTFERGSADPFDDATVELIDSAAAVLGPILNEKRHNDRLILTKVGLSLRTQLQRLLGAGYLVRKLVVILVVAAVLFFALAKGQYRVTANTTLEGEVRRVVTAPFRGFVHEAPVRGGDIVRRGQTMCELDVRDLELELARSATERDQHIVERRRAMAAGDRAAAGVLAKEIGQADAQVALLRAQIERARIVAPFDGVVVRGDLSQSLGSPVEPGAVLFEIAPLESYRLKLEVDERDITEIRQGQRGRLVLTAMPGEPFSFSVTKVTPVSRSAEGRNVFTVEGQLDNISERLRPGMEGISKVEVDRRRLIWIWTHALVDWLRVRIWKWMP